MSLKKSVIYVVCFLIMNLNAQTISYDWLEKIGLGKEMLRGVALKHSNKTVTTAKKIKAPQIKSRPRSRRKPKTIIRKYTDYAWKEAALAIMNIDDGNLEVIKIKKYGQDLLNINPRFKVWLEPRPSGLTWNGKNTAFCVVSKNSTFAVVADKWLERLPYGKPKEHIYSPFSTKLNQKELIEAGDKHLDVDIDQAIDQLASWGVESLAIPNSKVSDIVPRNFPKNIVLNEHTDPQEFYAFLGDSIEYNPFERVKIIIGANGDMAYAETVSSAKAIGLAQFTEYTWNSMVKKYVHAKLPQFKNGVTDHVHSLQATILLYDYNLSRLVEELGKDISKDPKLESYLAAAHNCGVERVVKAIRKSRRDWRQALRQLGKTDETIIYLEKLDYLLKNQTN